MSEIDQRDSINDDVSLFDDMSQGLAELLGSCSIIDKTTKQNDDDDTEQRTDTINIPSLRVSLYLRVSQQLSRVQIVTYKHFLNSRIVNPFIK